MNDACDLLRSWFQQRRELGDDELVLDQLSVAELREIVTDRPARGPRPADAAASIRPARPRESTESRPPVEAAEPVRPAAIDAPVPGLVETHRRAGAPVPGTTAHPPSPLAPARYASAEEIAALPVLNAVREIALGCPRCGLAKTRTHVVFGEGSETADVMVVGEAPGQEEDRSGRPFVGRAGQLLDLLLLSSGFQREDVYVCNVLKCRPPQNRNPQPDEVDACSPYLLRQVQLVKPRVILAFGAFAAQTLLGTDITIGKLRGRTHQYRGIPLVPTYHPAACLRHPAWVRSVWEDLQRARDVLEAA
ncbi:MAG: Uracil-DNA glycosylase, family 4 [uncultured Gemmatimonadetes bacterium]|uniref:Type-4 uracil-DNA glycosylase n=1 Tax=uncultured Gemmatimonadota bacterium TaxID=203437 RepID=A0A6J4MHR0_9BACT|nr:MAG: Uracil-DNA glycosylase, family 4 [uncultured Gemmatimonadota bacterium]